jgi:HTH-type transcriptional regulator/antitoxin MqsA
MTERLCPHDGTIMRREVKPMTITYKGRSETADFPGWTCKECGERVFSGKDLKNSDRILNHLRARHLGFLEAADIRRIRKKLNLTQEKAGELMGGGPRAFQKYESGELLQSRGVNSVLLLLDNDPSGLSVLEMCCRKETARKKKIKLKEMPDHDRPHA